VKPNWYIYCLLDPRTSAVRYVGVSKNPAKRLRDHLKHAHLAKTYKDNWLCQLAREGLKPVQTIVASGSGDDWDIAEREWIARLRAEGCKLTNACAGGRGVLDPSPESRAKNSAFHTGRTLSPGGRAKVSAALRLRVRSAETRAKVAAAMRGKKMPREGVEKAAAKRRGCKRPREAVERQAAKLRGRPQTPEHVAKRTAQLKGRVFTDDWRAKLSAAQKERFTKPQPAKPHKPHDPLARYCRCFDCKLAGRGKPKGRPRIVQHDPNHHGCSCIDCRIAGKGRPRKRPRIVQHKSGYCRCMDCRIARGEFGGRVSE
jgi:hypothetical protein